jgi:hypothetical protein
MTSPKVLAVILVLIVVLFGVFSVRGAHTNDSATTTDDPKTDAQNNPPQKYPPINALGMALGKFGPKVTESQLQPTATTWNLQSTQSFAIKVAADPDHTFRNIKFKMQPPAGTECAQIIYDNAGTPPAHLSSLQHQDPVGSRQPNDTADKYQAPLVVLAGGGTITIRRAGGYRGPCTVQMQ